MDISSGFDYPNPYGLLASDFSYDMESYGIALCFLSDLSGGADETRALEANGASQPMLRSWEGSTKFRRVLSKCRAAAEADRQAAAAKARDVAERPVDTGAQRFVRLEDAPLPTRSVFYGAPTPAHWGG